MGSLAARARQAAAGRGPISVEVMPSQPARPPRVRYHVSIDDKVKVEDEDELVSMIRKGKLTGMELVRREDEERWVPLFETRVYRLEVPHAGDPRDRARMRALRALGGHFSGFFITGVVMFSIQGKIPFWMAIWGAVLAVQTLGSLPALMSLWRSRSPELMDLVPMPAIPAAPVAKPLPPPVPDASDVVAQEAARVRALIQQRGGPDAARHIAEVDGIQRMTAELAAREADLEEQTTERERTALATAIAAARDRLDRAEMPEDRRLFERQLEVLVGREEAIGKAMRLLDRLRVRRDLAEHQLKQLRLDLSRGAAGGLDVPELSSRLQFIRYEVDAREEVEQIVADKGGAS
jgi:hypothetical protein